MCGSVFGVSGSKEYVGDVHEFFIPIPHFTSCIPEGSVHAYEITPSHLLQCLFEFLPAH